MAMVVDAAPTKREHANKGKPANSPATTPTAVVAKGGGRNVDSTEIDAWLTKNPVVRDRIVWIAGDGKKLSFPQWTHEMKQRLALFYTRQVAGERELGMALPSLERVSKAGQAYFTADEAFDAYAANVAHALHLEIKHLVPWSIAARPSEELDVLLCSERYCARIVPSVAHQLYPAGIMPNRDPYIPFRALAETPGSLLESQFAMPGLAGPVRAAGAD